MEKWELNNPVDAVNFNLFDGLSEIKKAYKNKTKNYLSLLLKGVKYNERL